MSAVSSTIGVVVPVHNEEHFLSACLDSIEAAADRVEAQGERVLIVTALDACTDRSAQIACAHGVEVVALSARSVGSARAVGAALALESGVRWLAFTDADTIVAPSWLERQLEIGADAVCGTVGIAGWQRDPPVVHLRYQQGYRDAEGHRHIHGANLGVSARAYRAVGGFAPLALHEDVALVAALERAGYRIAWSCRPRVTTSSRLDNRVAGGFAGHLLALALQPDV